MRTAWTVALLAALVSAAPGLARADEVAPQGGAPPPAAEPPPSAEPPATPPPPPARAPVVAPVPVDPTPPEGANPDRPDAFAVGIGIGYRFPAGLDRPDSVSVRFRMASGLTIEPVVILGGGGRTTSVTQFGMSNDRTDSATQLSAGANLRLPLKSRASLELLFVAGASLGYLGQDPEGDDNNTRILFAQLSWGLGVDWWITRSWCLGLTGSNPLVSYVSQKDEQGPDSSTTTTDTSYGLTFNPRVALLVHLFF